MKEKRVDLKMTQKFQMMYLKKQRIMKMIMTQRSKSAQLKKRK